MEDCFIIYEGTLTVHRHIEILKNQLRDIMDSIPIRALKDMLFQQDGSPAYKARMVANYSNKKYPDQ